MLLVPEYIIGRILLMVLMWLVSWPHLKTAWVCMALLLMPRSRALLPVGFITVTVRLRAARTFMFIMCSIRKSRLSIIPGELGAI